MDSQRPGNDSYEYQMPPPGPSQQEMHQHPDHAYQQPSPRHPQDLNSPYPTNSPMPREFQEVYRAPSRTNSEQRIGATSGAQAASAPVPPAHQSIGHAAPPQQSAFPPQHPSMQQQHHPSRPPLPYIETGQHYQSAALQYSPMNAGGYPSQLSGHSDNSHYNQHPVTNHDGYSPYGAPPPHHQQHPHGLPSVYETNGGRNSALSASSGRTGNSSASTSSPVTPSSMNSTLSQGARNGPPPNVSSRSVSYEQLPRHHHPQHDYARSPYVPQGPTHGGPPPYAVPQHPQHPQHTHQNHYQAPPGPPPAQYQLPPGQPPYDYDPRAPQLHQAQPQSHLYTPSPSDEAAPLPPTHGQYAVLDQHQSRVHRNHPRSSTGSTVSNQSTSTENSSYGGPPSSTLGDPDSPSATRKRIARRSTTSSVSSSTASNSALTTGSAGGSENQGKSKKSRQLKDDESDDLDAELLGAAVTDSPEQRKEDARQQRMNAEQRRRDQLRDGYDRLQAGLPSSREKLSKVKLIESATQYIQSLTEIEAENAARIAQLEQERDELRRLNEEISQSLGSGGPLPAGVIISPKRSPLPAVTVPSSVPSSHTPPAAASAALSRPPSAASSRPPGSSSIPLQSRSAPILATGTGPPSRNRHHISGGFPAPASHASSPLRDGNEGAMTPRADDGVVDALMSDGTH